MIVYRVENDCGRGFYHDRFNCKFPIVDDWYPIIRHCSYDAAYFFITTVHPSASKEVQDIAYKDDSSFVFGFSSEQEMKDWFPDFILKGVAEKFGKIIMYEIDEQYVIIDNKQCIFDISKSSIIGEFHA